MTEMVEHTLSKVVILKDHQFNYRIVVTELAFLILKTERILFNNRLNKNPIIFVRKFQLYY